MKVDNLTTHSEVYTSNVYLLTGNWNTLNDLNTLIDVGRDPSILEKIDNAATGVGKQRVEQVILTHSHYDHASLLPVIKKIYNPKVFAASPILAYVDVILKGGETLKIADREFEVIYMPGHSNDSICLYCEEEGILFAGDTSLIICSPGGSYEEGFVNALESICQRDIQTIYFGHGNPLNHACNKALQDSLTNVHKS